MSRHTMACVIIVPVALIAVGCANSPQNLLGAEYARANVARTPAWNKYSVAGSRIPRQLDAQGQPNSGSHIVTITDEELQNSAGVLLGDKLSGGYSR